MIDPHVETLHYRVKSPHDTIFECLPLEYETEEFRLHLEDDRLAVEIQDYYAEEVAAREAVEPFLRAWEVAAGLRIGPGEFHFAYERASVVDRALQPPVDLVTGAPQAPRLTPVCLTDLPAPTLR